MTAERREERGCRLGALLDAGASATRRLRLAAAARAERTSDRYERPKWLPEVRAGWGRWMNGPGPGEDDRDRKPPRARRERVP
jgi:hypothetical protein